MSNNTIRITVVGDGDTGKTCMLIVYKDKKFDDRYVPTVFDVYSMTIPINDLEYKVILSDTAGQEEFDKLRRMAYKDVDAFILTYAVNERDSFENVFTKWAPELRRFAPKAKIILAGTKCDLRSHSPRHVKTEDGERLARDIEAHGFIENSSKQQRNIDATFQMAILSAISNTRFIKKKRKNDCWLL
ncbi:ras-like GTP-binding protein RhoL [Anoplophora glabripennis]|uniref:Ras-like GTP-binding protein n=1 Tax=Anoplophora glabripennis TaxID=217634 RepID=V5GQV2_ANOGL|nr:ras-like GTP-binding protein RhoL [Anoplophora glabripennis]XP_023313073.1 ras-like GTP-binding protein RhoL [Anoplophora glabripennis]